MHFKDALQKNQNFQNSIWLTLLAPAYQAVQWRCHHRRTYMVLASGSTEASNSGFFQAAEALFFTFYLLKYSFCLIFCFLYTSIEDLYTLQFWPLSMCRRLGRSTQIQSLWYAWCWRGLMLDTVEVLCMWKAHADAGFQTIEVGWLWRGLCFLYAAMHH